MIAHCKNCGIVFESRALSFKGSINVTISNVFESCPQCGNIANVLDGTFDFDANGNATLVSGPPLTRNIVNAIRNLVEIAKKENFTKEKFIEEANNISPEAGDYLAKFVPKSFSDIMAFFMFILAILAYLESRQPKHEAVNNIIVVKNYTEIERKPMAVNKGIKKAKPGLQKKRKR
jgi:hypothetical protein